MTAFPVYWPPNSLRVVAECLSMWASKRQTEKWVEKLDFSPYVRHYPSAACIVFFRDPPPPQHFQLHGPQTGPLIPSRFFPLKCVDFCSFFPQIRSPTSAAAKEMISCRNPTLPPSPLRPLHKHTYISYRHDVFAQYMKPETIFADCQANRTVLLFFFYEPESSSKHKDCGVSREAP